MLPKLKRFIAENELLIDEDRLLLAVSGGKDSVCLLHLFTQLDYPLAVAHCNFLLRGEESNKDEQFVRSLSEHYELPFFVSVLIPRPIQMKKAFLYKWRLENYVIIGLLIWVLIK